MLTGGSQDNESSIYSLDSSKGSFTRNGVKTLYARTKLSLAGFIQPAFSSTMNKLDKEYKKSWEAYRIDDLNNLDIDTQTPKFTAWFYVVLGYRFFGRLQHTFLSPHSVTKYYPAGWDPIRDVYKYVEQKGNTEEKELFNLGKRFQISGNRFKTIAPYTTKTPREFAMLNFLVEESTGYENCILVLTKSAFLELKRDLSKTTPRSATQSLDSDWEDFLYGDITNPKKCAKVCLLPRVIPAGNQQMEICSIRVNFDVKQKAANHGIVYEDISEYLESRYDISDTDNVTNLKPRQEAYQDMLDYLVMDGIVPIPILERACGQYGEIRTELRDEEYSWWDHQLKAGSSDERESFGGASGGSLASPQSQPANIPESIDSEEDDIPYTNPSGDKEEAMAPISAMSKEEIAEELKILQEGLSTGRITDPAKITRYLELSKA